MTPLIDILRQATDWLERHPYIFLGGCWSLWVASVVLMLIAVARTTP